MGVIYTGGRLGSHGIDLCVDTGDGLLYQNIPLDQADKVIEQGAYYYNGDIRLNDAERTTWCNTRHPNELSQQTIAASGAPLPKTLPSVGSDNTWVVIALAIAIFIGIIAHSYWRYK